MKARKMPALPFALVLGLTAIWLVLFFGLNGVNADTALGLTRITARTSVFFFLAAFTASALLKLWRTEAARFLVMNRRYIGLSFALAHFIHLGALIAFFAVSGERPGLVTIIGGGGAYLFIALMAATSNDRSVRKLGPNWRRLHLTGSWYVWVIFLNSYAGRVAEGREPRWMFAGLAFLLIAAAGLRIAAWVKGRAAKRARRAAEPA